jgi:hypothetical protein
VSVLDQVANVRDATQARALRDRYLAELAKPSLSQARALELDDAINQLESEWPELESSTGGGEPAGQGGGAKRTGGARRARSSGARGAGGRRPSVRRRSRAGRALGLSGSRAWSQTGIPGGVASTTDVVMQVLGATVALTVLYLFIANRRGVGALTDISRGTATALRRIVAPVDPLGGGRQRVAIAAGSGGGALRPFLSQPARPRPRRHNVGSRVGSG